jgi:penicillin amidase
MRRLRFRRVAEQALERTSPATRRALESYSAGVNAWLAARRGDLPPEFKLLRFRPEPWSPVDTLAFVQMMARNLSPIDVETRKKTYLDYSPVQTVQFLVTQ